MKQSDMFIGWYSEFVWFGLDQNQSPGFYSNEFKGGFIGGCLRSTEGHLTLLSSH